MIKDNGDVNDKSWEKEMMYLSKRESKHFSRYLIYLIIHTHSSDDHVSVSPRQNYDAIKQTKAETLRQARDIYNNDNDQAMIRFKMTQSSSS